MEARIERAVVVTTNFLYRDYQKLAEGEQRQVTDTDGVRGDLALLLLSKAADLGVRVVACDGGSSGDFNSALEHFIGRGLTVVYSDPFRGPQRRAAFEEASSLPNTQAIVYTQAEKAPLMNFLIPITKPVVEGEVDIVIPERNPDLFKTSYPFYLWQSEVAVNQLYNRMTMANFDWFFGPVVFRNEPEVSSLFLKKYQIDDGIKSLSGVSLDPEKHSNSYYFPILEAIYRKMRVIGVEIPFQYPEAQYASEMDLGNIEAFQKRRREDADVYVDEAYLFWDFLNDNPRSRMREVQA